MTANLLEHFYKLGSPHWVNSGWMKCWPLLSFPLLTSPDTVRHTGSGVMPCSDQPVDPHTVSTQLGHMSLVVQSVWMLYTNNLTCWPMSEGFSNLSTPADNMWHQSFLFFLLARFSHFNPCFLWAQRGRERKMGVSARRHTAAEGH